MFGADLRGAKLDGADLKDARFDCDTRFSEDYDPIRAGVKLLCQANRVALALQSA
jgi:uncharacterized protein YjbI with pentapeptide repeats